MLAKMDNKMSTTTIGYHLSVIKLTIHQITEYEDDDRHNVTTSVPHKQLGEEAFLSCS